MPLLATILFTATLTACSAAPESDASAQPAPSAVPTPAVDVGADADAAPAPAASCAYAPVERGTFTSSTDGKTTTYVWLTPSPVGVIVALHGTGGSSRSLAEVQVEWASFFQLAHARGYAIVIPESVQRESPRQWDVKTTGPDGDVARIDAVLSNLIASGALTSSTPIYTVGMSQGGGAAPVLGGLLALAGRPVRAVGVYCAGGSSVFDRAQYTLPTTFNLMAKDEIVSDVAAVESNVKTLHARGVDAELFVQPATRACPGRFARIPGIDEAASREIFDALVAAGTLDAEGNVPFRQRGDAVPGLPPAYAPFDRLVDEQLRVLMASHAFYADRNDATLSFFDAHR